MRQIFKSIKHLILAMYENIKYKISNIINNPGPRFEVHVLWLEENKYEKIFMNDEYLEESKLIQRLDDFYEQFHNSEKDMPKDEKIKLIDNIKKKYCEVPKAK